MLIMEGFNLYRYTSLKEPITDFNSEELNVVDEVIEKLSSMNATQISESL